MMKWTKILKHRKATLSVWNEGKAVPATTDGPSQYNPQVLQTDADIEMVELVCARLGRVIGETANMRKAFLEMGVCIGACSGVTTNYLYAEWNKISGDVHGRPVSAIWLTRMKVKL